LAEETVTTLAAATVTILAEETVPPSSPLAAATAETVLRLCPPAAAAATMAEATGSTTRHIAGAPRIGTGLLPTGLGAVRAAIRLHSAKQVLSSEWAGRAGTGARAADCPAVAAAPVSATALGEPARPIAPVAPVWAAARGQAEPTALAAGISRVAVEGTGALSEEVPGDSTDRARVAAAAVASPVPDLAAEEGSGAAAAGAGRRIAGGKSQGAPI